MENILVIRYGTIGDCVFASAFYRELRSGLPNAKIDILVDNISADTMKFCPYINETYLINGKYKNIFWYIKLFKKYDTIFFLKNDKFFTRVAKFANVKNRIGFDIPRNKHLTLMVPYNEDRHEIDCYLDLLKMSGIYVSSSNTEVWIDNKSAYKIADLYTFKNTKKVLIQAYSRFNQKNWLDEYWVDLINYLSKLNVQIFLCGSNKDSQKYESLIKYLDNKFSVINASGKLSVNESMALVKNMDLVIGIDSGIIHVAAALDIPSILLHGPTSLLRWLPRSDNCTVLSANFVCSPCCLQSKTTKYCKKHVSRCMAYVKPDKVKDVIAYKFKSMI